MAAAVARESGWHGWQWNLRLAEAQAELALARGQWDQAIEHATLAIDRSLAPGRVKYQVAALSTRGRALMEQEHPDASADLDQAVDLAKGRRRPGVISPRVAGATRLPRRRRSPVRVQTRLQDDNRRIAGQRHAAASYRRDCISIAAALSAPPAR